jgi:hypothetical protein
MDAVVSLQIKQTPKKSASTARGGGGRVIGRRTWGSGAGCKGAAKEGQAFEKATLEDVNHVGRMDGATM